MYPGRLALTALCSALYWPGVAGATRARHMQATSRKASRSLPPREKAGGKGHRGFWDKAPHPNPLPQGEGTWRHV